MRRATLVLAPTLAAAAGCAASEPTKAQDAQGLNPSAGDSATGRRRGPPRDEAAILADLRQRALQDVHQSYSLLLDDLNLTPRQREGVVAVLAELQVDSVWVNEQKRGRSLLRRKQAPLTEKQRDGVRRSPLRAPTRSSAPGN